MWLKGHFYVSGEWKLLLYGVRTYYITSQSTSLIIQHYITFYTSVVIYHRGASLSEQHTDLLIIHWIKQDLSHASSYLGITYISQQP